MSFTAQSWETDIDHLARSTRIRQLHTLWQGLAAEGVPLLSDLMEAGLGEMSAHYSILVPDGTGRFAYLHYGAALAKASGRERTGRTTDDLAPEIRGYLQREYARALDIGRPIYLVHLAHLDVPVDSWESLAAPVATEGDLKLLLVLCEPNQLQDTLASAVVEASPDALFALRPLEDDLGTPYDARIMMANHSACRLSHRSRDDLVGTNFLAAYPQAKSNGVWDLCCEVLETRHASRFDIDLAAGEVSGQFRVTLFPYLGGLAVMLQDISDLSGDAIPLIRRRASNIKHFAIA